MFTEIKTILGENIFFTNFHWHISYCSWSSNYYPFKVIIACSEVER